MTPWGVSTIPPQHPLTPYTKSMNKTQAIETLSTAFGAYRGTCVPDYLTPQEMGIVWHRFADTIIQEKDLVGMATRYAA